MATGTFYLRPNADISLGHSKTPAESTAGYLLICDETSDDTTTEIYNEVPEPSNAGSVTSVFGLGGAIPSSENFRKITKMTIESNCRLNTTNNISVSYVNLTFKFGNVTEFTIKHETSKIGYSSETNTLDSSNASVIALNNYLLTNGTLPTAQVTISTVHEGNADDGDGKTDAGQMGVSKVAIKFDYTNFAVTSTLLGVEWTPVQDAWYKQNGQWTRISENTLLSLIQSEMYAKHPPSGKSTYPMFRSDWKQGRNLTKVTAIHLVDSYTPTGSESDSWVADLDLSGGIRCYLKGTELIISGNGSGGMCINLSGQESFGSGSETVTNEDGSTSYIYHLTSITGLDLLWHYDKTTMRGLYGMVPNWNIDTLDLSKYDIESTMNIVSSQSLKTVILPNNLKYISAQAFGASGIFGVSTLNGNPNLSSINLPNTLTDIGIGAFAGCNFETITLPESLINLGVGCDEGQVYLSNNLADILGGAFSRNPLKSITIPDSVTSIGKFCFDSCENLTSVKLSKNLTSIGEGIFAFCNSLTSIEIPNGVTTIPACAFYQCKNLNRVILPDSVTAIRQNAFISCSNLKYLNIPKNLQLNVSYNPFYGILDELELTVGSDNPTYQLINGCLYDKTQNAVVLHDKNFTQLPNDTKILGTELFCNTQLFNAINIPASVTNIYTNALNSKYITNVRFLSTTPPSLTSGAIQYIPTEYHNNISMTSYTGAIFNTDTTYDDGSARTLTITVPAGCGETYKAASGWSTYADYIVEAT